MEEVEEVKELKAEGLTEEMTEVRKDGRKDERKRVCVYKNLCSYIYFSRPNFNLAPRPSLKNDLLLVFKSKCQYDDEGAPSKNSHVLNVT